MADTELQQSYLPSFLQSNRYLPLPSAPTPWSEMNPASDILKPNIGQIIRSKRFRFVAVALSIAGILGYLFRLSDGFYVPKLSSKSPPSAGQCEQAGTIDWSRFAYTQYVTNAAYLCNSVMLFEILHRLGSKADRLMMYPDTMDMMADNAESALLRKAQNEYHVKLMPVKIQHRDGGDDATAATWADSYTKLLAFNQTQYDRVLSLDSDSTVLQPMDELFLLPPAPVAMPRAYWLQKHYLSSQLVLIQPSSEEFKRIEEAIHTAKGGDFDMEIVNDVYGKDCMIIPHRRYDLITGEFRGQGTHEKYLGNTYEKWDPEKMLKEAKFVHFSDWPVPKPWIDGGAVMDEKKPNCSMIEGGGEDCRARDIWLGFYSDFKERRRNVCSLETGVNKKAPRSLQAGPKPWEFVLP